MEKEKQTEELGAKKITLWYLLSWFFGIIFLIATFTSISSSPLTFLSSFLISLIILPPINDKLKEEYKISLSFGVKSILVIILLFTFSPSTDTGNQISGNPQAQQKLDQKLNLSIGYRPNQKGFSIPVFEIRNESNTHWSDCKITLNDRTYKTEMSDILTVNEFRADMPDSSGSHFMMSNRFTKDDGTIFNPYTTAPKSICVRCNEPNYDLNCWGF